MRELCSVGGRCAGGADWQHSTGSGATPGHQKKGLQRRKNAQPWRSTQPPSAHPLRLPRASQDSGTSTDRMKRPVMGISEWGVLVRSKADVRRVLEAAQSHNDYAGDDPCEVGGGGRVVGCWGAGERRGRRAGGRRRAGRCGGACRLRTCVWAGLAAAAAARLAPSRQPVSQPGLALRCLQHSAFLLPPTYRLESQ